MADDKPKLTRALEDLFARLAEPFHPSEIKWRVTHTNQAGDRGAVIAFADPRAYTDRLNRVFTPAGWSRSFEVSTISSVTRIRKDKVTQTGKVLVVCTLTIHGIGTHSGSGEEWADKENAMTYSEAQAFKRAASCFGLGRYLYNLSEVWVRLDPNGRPAECPRLPDWALPGQGAGFGGPGCGSQQERTRPGPIDRRLTARIEGFRQILGGPIYAEILGRAAGVSRASMVPDSAQQAKVAETMDRASRGVAKARLLAEEAGEAAVAPLVSGLQIESIKRIPSLRALKELVAGLERLDLPARR